MDHVAILKSSLGFLEKIKNGTKTIESRWYSKRISPWNQIKAGEIIYFKNSGSPITLKCQVEKVLQFSDLTSTKIEELLRKYGKYIGFTLQQQELFYKEICHKNYAILIFLSQVQSLKPFDIDKTGFGNMSAWLSVADINLIKKL